MRRYREYAREDIQDKFFALERIAADEAFGISQEKLGEITDPERFIGRAPEQVDRFLAEWVQPALERLEAGANERLGEPDVRV